MTAHLQLGPVGGTDGLGNRQTEPHACARPVPAFDPPEGLDQRRHHIGGHPGSAVGDPEKGTPFARAGRHPDPAACFVVPDGVVDQVPDHPLDELLITGHLGGRERSLYP